MAKDKTPAKADKDDTPAYLKGGEYEPQKDNFDSSDVALPRLKLLQGLSSEVEDFDNATIGNFWHTGMDQDMGPEVRFVIIGRNKKYLLTAPLEDGQGILARADDAKTWDRTGEWEVKVDKKTKVTWKIEDTDVLKSGLTEWGTYDPEDDNSPPAATLFYDYLALLPDHLELGPVVISLTRSSISAAKKGLNDKIQLHKGAGRPMQAVVFVARSIDKSSDSGDYKSWQFTSGGFAEETLFKQAWDLRGLAETYKVQDEAGAAVDDGKGEGASADAEM